MLDSVLPDDKTKRYDRQLRLVLSTYSCMIDLESHVLPTAYGRTLVKPLLSPRES